MTSTIDYTQVLCLIDNNNVLEVPRNMFWNIQTFSFRSTRLMFLVPDMCVSTYIIKSDVICGTVECDDARDDDGVLDTNLRGAVKGGRC